MVVVVSWARIWLAILSAAVVGWFWPETVTRKLWVEGYSPMGKGLSSNTDDDDIVTLESVDEAPLTIAASINDVTNAELKVWPVTVTLLRQYTFEVVGVRLSISHT